jgi:hypothetical protein
VLATVCLALVAAVFVTAAVRNVWLSAAAVMTVVALVLPIVAIGRAAPNLDQPRPNHLFYVFDGNSETASWASAEELHDDWSARVMPAPERVKDTQLFPARYRSFARATFYRAAAPSGLVEAPTAAMSSDSMDGGVRTVVFTVRSARQAPEMWTCIDSDVPIQSAQIDGLDVTSSGRKLERDAKSTCVLYRGAAEGTFQVQVRTQGVGDFTVEMMDRDYQLPTAYVDRRLERPESTMPAPFVGDAAFARRSQAF